MNWIDSHSRVDEGVTVGSCRINRLLLADDLVLLASSQQFSAGTRSVFCCVRPSRNENQHKNTEVLCLSTHPRQCMRQVSGGEVQVPRGGFTSDGRRSARRLIHRLVKLTQFCVSFIALWTKREPSNTAKLSVFTSVFVPILTYGYGQESWVMAERILTQVQAPKMGLLRKVHSVTKGRIEVTLRPGQKTSLAPPYLNLRCFGSKCIALKKKRTTLLRLFGAPQWFGARALSPPRYAPAVTLRDNVRSCEYRRGVNAEPLLLIQKTQLKLVGPCIQNAQRKTGGSNPAG